MTDALALLSRIEADLAELRRILDAPTPAEPACEEWLQPCEIAFRLGIGENYVRRIIRRGVAEGVAGCEKRGGRLYATADAVKGLWTG